MEALIATLKTIRKRALLRVFFLLSLASAAGGFLGMVAVAILLHRFRFPLDTWLPGASQVFLPAYFLGGILMALTLYVCKDQVSAKAVFFPGVIAGVIGPCCGLILSVPIVCLIASECL
ncbi:hypothetical protein [Herbaspirillum rhizosphaerae]|uniref:hypothetical protein n=1 Tax=Herbaspirillum rhizosphaerae TaxID=346179 RepID=UPI0012EDAD05|nr:hypothetical protein [Herbaspirillum rhizosphaerae]